MSVDVRISEIFKEYKTEWDDSIIEILKKSLRKQVFTFLKNYKDRLQETSSNILHDIPICSKKDYLFEEYKTLGFFVLWIRLLRTLDVRVSYMILQRASIIFTQYLIVYSQAKNRISMVDFSLKDLMSYILKNLFGNLEVPIVSNIKEDNRNLLWSTIVKLYSKFTIEYE
mgnify:CR=1 FL=1